MDTIRYFMPGSKWAYFKIYTGNKTSDLLLVDYIYPLVNRLLEKNVIDGFFFIRYFDTNYHLRVRFRLTQSKEFSFLLTNLYKMFSPLLEQDLISDLHFCTYKRELERYGCDTIELVEDFFFLDSLIVIDLIRYLYFREDNNEALKLQCAVYMIDSILNLFDKDLNGKEKIMLFLSNNFLEEYKFKSKAHTGVLNKKYREYKYLINQTLECPSDYLLNITCIYREKAKIIVSKIIYLTTNGTHEKIDKILCSLIHMFMNRFFSSDNRLYEMLIYYFLVKNYRSAIALEHLNLTKKNI